MEENKEIFKSVKSESEIKRRCKNPFRTQRQKEEKERRQKKRARVIIRNISFKANDEEVKKHLEQWGKIEEFNLLKREDGKSKGCAFVQYETINQASKAILNGNGKEFLGRPIALDWAIGKSQYTTKLEQSGGANQSNNTEIKDEEACEVKQEPAAKKLKIEKNAKSKNKNECNDTEKKEFSEHEEAEFDESGEEEEAGQTADGADADEEENIDCNESEKYVDEIEAEDENEDDDDEDDDEKKDIKDIKVKREKHISNDVQDGCTVFIKNVPFDVEDDQLRKVCRRFGLLHYAIINREKVSGHSKGTAFVKFRTKESANLCLQSGSEFRINEDVLEVHPALSRDEVNNKLSSKGKDNEKGKDSRNLYLAREGLIMAGSKAAEGISTADMAKRHELEKIKSHFLKNLNRFVSRNRLSIHNLPASYDNEKLRQLVIAHTALRPHECRVMRENKITADHPVGKSKEFGFMSFNTHQDALQALRKLNNNPKVFTSQRRPIVAFSIEDRSVHKLKENRNQRSKLNNPTYRAKLEQSKNNNKNNKKPVKLNIEDQSREVENKLKIQKQLKFLEKKRTAKEHKVTESHSVEVRDEYMGEPAEPGKMLRMRSNKKLAEQANAHLKRLKDVKRKKKHEKIKQTHHPAQKRVKILHKSSAATKLQKDDLMPLVEKYKKLINETKDIKVKKPKRTKWYATE